MKMAIFVFLTMAFALVCVADDSADKSRKLEKYESQQVVETHK